MPNSERMASPIILRPIAIGDGKFQAGTLVLPHQQLKMLRVDIKLARQCARANSVVRETLWWGDSAKFRIDQIANLTVSPFSNEPGIRPLKRNLSAGNATDDVLQIFCNFFQKNPD